MKSIAFTILGILGLCASAVASDPEARPSEAEFLAKIEAQTLADILATLLAAEDCEGIQLDESLSFSHSSRTYDRKSDVRLDERCAADAKIGERWVDIRIERIYDHYDEKTGTASPVSTKADVEWTPLNEAESFEAAFRELLSHFTDDGHIWLDPETSLCTTLGAGYEDGVWVEASSCGDSAGVVVKINTIADDEGVTDALERLKRAARPGSGDGASPASR